MSTDFGPWKMSTTKLHNVNTAQPRQRYNSQILETPMVVIPHLFAFYCFVTLKPWKTSTTKLHNVHTTQNLDRDITRKV